MTTPTTPREPLDLEALERAHEAASVGDWIIERGDFSGRNWLIASLGADSNCESVHITTDGVHASETNGADATDDANAIVLYRKMVPALLARIRELEAERAALVKAVEEVRVVVEKLKAGNGDEYDIGCIVERALAQLLTTPERTVPPQGA